MKLSSVIESSAVAIFDEPPNANLFAPDLVAEMVRKYRFVEFPNTAEKFKTDITLLLGSFEGAIIDKMTLYTDGVFISTQAESPIIARFIDDVLNLLEGAFGIDMRNHKRKVFYSSRIEVELEPGLERVLGALDGLCKLMDRLTAGHGFEPPSYRGAAFSLATEKQGQLTPGRFILEPRAGHDLSENCFYSEAPVTTSEHCKLLESLERLF